MGKHAVNVRCGHQLPGEQCVAKDSIKYLFGRSLRREIEKKKNSAKAH